MRRMYNTIAVRAAGDTSSFVPYIIGPVDRLRRPDGVEEDRARHVFRGSGRVVPNRIYTYPTNFSVTFSSVTISSHPPLILTEKNCCMSTTKIKTGKKPHRNLWCCSPSNLYSHAHANTYICIILYRCNPFFKRLLTMAYSLSRTT